MESPRTARSWSKPPAVLVPARRPEHDGSELASRLLAVTTLANHPGENTRPVRPLGAEQRHPGADIIPVDMVEGGSTRPSSAGTCRLMSARSSFDPAVTL